MLRNLWRRLRRPYEYPVQRARRQYLETLAMAVPASAEWRPSNNAGARVEPVCRCGHEQGRHVIVSQDQATCLGACTCIVFRAARLAIGAQ